MKMRDIMSLVESALSPEELVLKDMMTKADMARFEKWFRDNGEPSAKDDPDQMIWEFSYYLKDELSLDVDEHGRVSFWNPDGEAWKLIGNHPVKLFHFTSSSVVPSIRKYGITAGNKSVNRTQAPGVYLTLEYGNAATDGYFRNAVSNSRDRNAHGVVIHVWMYMSELQFDSDDAHLSSGRNQFVTDHVPPDRIISIEKA